MDNINECDFYNFAKQYIKIKNKNGNVTNISDNNLSLLKEMDEKINDGYELKLIKSRCGIHLEWIK